VRIIFPQVNVRAVDSSLSAVGDPLYATMDTLRHLDLGGRTGWALVVRRFDETFAADPDWARGLSEVVARASYEHLLMGGRF
jgi:hypothetical protein